MEEQEDENLTVMALANKNKILSERVMQLEARLDESRRIMDDLLHYITSTD